MQSSLSNLVGLTPTLILILFSLILIAGWFALRSGIRSRRHRNREEEYGNYLRDLQKQGDKLVKRLSRGCLGYRVMSACLAGIEVLGGAYFAITGSSVNTINDQNSQSHVTAATLIGFAIIVTSAMQNRVHPYAKAVELRFRKWNLDFILDRSEKAKLDGIENSHIADVLIMAIRDATRPFSDKPEQPTSEDSSVAHLNSMQIQPTAQNRSRDVPEDVGGADAATQHGEQRSKRLG